MKDEEAEVGEAQMLLCLARGPEKAKARLLGRCRAFRLVRSLDAIGTYRLPTIDIISED